MKEGVGTRPLFHEGEKEKYQKGNGPWVGECPKGWRNCIRRGGLANGGNVRLVGWGPVEENKKH